MGNAEVVAAMDVVHGLRAPLNLVIESCHRRNMLGAMGVSRKSAIFSNWHQNFATGILTSTFLMDGPPISLGRPSLEQPDRRICQLGGILSRSDEIDLRRCQVSPCSRLTWTVAVSFDLEDYDSGRSDLGLVYDREGERSLG